MAKVIKDLGHYYFVMDGVLVDVTDIIESELRERIQLEIRLAEYNKEVEDRANIQLVHLKRDLAAAKKHLEILTERSQLAFDAWSKDGNPHGAMIGLRPYLAFAKHWLEENK